MEPAPTSFIPKQTFSDIPRPRPSRGGRVGILSIIAAVFFFAALLLSIGVYGYQFYLERTINTKSQQLASAKSQFQPATIQELERLNTRLTAARDLLGSHVLSSKLFALLEEHTVANVRFTSLSYDTAESGTITLKLSGEARDFSSVALQSDEFSRVPYLRNAAFTDLNLGEAGTVVFTVSAYLDPSYLRAQYTAAPASVPVTAPATTTSATSAATTTDTTENTPAAPAAGTSTATTTP